MTVNKAKSIGYMIKGIKGIKGCRGRVIKKSDFIKFYKWLDNLLTKICREIARRE